MESKGSRKTNSTFVDVTQNYTLDCIKLDNMRRYPNIHSGGLIISMSTLRKALPFTQSQPKATF